MTGGIPADDTKFLAYCQALSSNLSDRPAAYGVAVADAAHLADLLEDYRLLLLACGNDATRTPTKILEKDQSKAVCRSFAMALVGVIKPNMGVSDANKRAAGIPLPRVGRGAPIPPPTTQPVLSIVGSIAGSMTVRFADAADPTRRARPYGVKGLNLYQVVSDAPVAGPEGATQVGGYTRGPIGVAFDGADDGKVVTFFACWISPTLASGPMSAPVSMRIAA